jgi:hypothetical protein
LTDLTLHLNAAIDHVPKRHFDIKSPAEHALNNAGLAARSRIVSGTPDAWTEQQFEQLVRRIESLGYDEAETVLDA